MCLPVSGTTRRPLRLKECGWGRGERKWGALQGSGEKRFHSEAPLDIIERNNGGLAYSGGSGDCENPEDSGELLKVEPTRNAGRLCGWQKNDLPKVAFPNPQAYELLPSLAREWMK